MTGSARLSRLNPVYLAVRNGGAVFLCAALGIAGGLVYQALTEPRSRVAGGSRILSAMPPDAGANHDWEAAARRIAAVLEAPAYRGLLSANLRHVVKRSLGGAAPDAADPAALRNRLLAYREPAVMDTSPWDRPFPPYHGPDLHIARSDLAVNMDLQSLAVVLADIDPPPGGEGWDFSFFTPLADVPAASDMVTGIEPEDRFFRVFHRIHELREGGPALSSAAAWRSAAAELDERLARESEFQGGGGFGGRAKAALLRELYALPILAANGLYGVVGGCFGEERASRERELWEERWNALRLRVDRTDPAHARLTLELPSALSPLFFPADSPLTRIDALAVETAFLFLDARMEMSAAQAAASRAKTPSEPEKPAAPPPPEPPVLPDDPPEPAPPEEPGHAEDPDRSDARIGELEREALAARTARDACFLRHQAALADAGAALAEALRARERADRFKERLDALEMDETSVVRGRLENPKAAGLRGSVEDIERRLAGLLLTCTEEHPFVRAARRELAVAERRLLEADDGAVEAALEERRIRVKNLRLEWRMADEAAGALAARRDHAATAAECLLGELSAAEGRLAAAEHAVRGATRNSSLRIDMLDRMTANMGRMADNILKASIPAAAPPGEKAAREPAPSPAPPEASRPVFVPGSAGIAVTALPLSALPLEIGAAAGLCLGILWTLVHELFGARLTNAFEAGRWVNAPVIASIPRYDAKSLALGARSMGGKLEPSGGRRTFIPPPADAAETVPLGKRRALTFRGTTRRRRGFILGAAVLLLAAGIRQAIVDDAWRMPPGGHLLVFREGRR